MTMNDDMGMEQVDDMALLQADDGYAVWAAMLDSEARQQQEEEDAEIRYLEQHFMRETGTSYAEGMT